MALAPMDPPWTLSGGAALAGFYTRHRDTRDLDLFWQGARALGDAGATATDLITQAGLGVSTLQASPTFQRLLVQDGTDTCAVDLVADPVPLAEPPAWMTLGAARFRIDTPHQILVNKLCALLGRSEPRDIEDIRALTDSGQDLPRALADCSTQEAGFSPLTLGWTLERMPVEALATALRWAPGRVAGVVAARGWLVQAILEAARPSA